MILSEWELRIIITPPNKIPVLTGDKVKTDKIDSAKLARFLSKDILSAIHIPSEELIDLRQTLSTRNQLVRKRTRIITQVKMLLLQFGISFEVKGSPNWYLEEILKLNLATHIQLSVNAFVEEIRFYNGLIHKFNDIYKNGPKRKNHGSRESVASIIVDRIIMAVDRQRQGDGFVL